MANGPQYAINPPLMAEGNIYPCRFVKGGSVAMKCLQAGANERSLGISGEDEFSPPVSAGALTVNTSTPGLHTVAGQACKIYGFGSIVLIELGSGGCTAFDFLKPDANGKGVVASSSTDVVGAQAIETGSAGERILCIVLPQYDQRRNPVDTTTFASAGATLTAANSGMTYLVGASALTVTLPATSAGVSYTFVMGTAGTLVFDPVTADKIIADGVALADNGNATVFGQRGMVVTLIADGVDGWYLRTTRPPVLLDTTTLGSAATSPVALTAADHGKTFIVDKASLVASLPATQLGLTFRFVVKTLSTGSPGFSLSPVAADKIMGAGLALADDADIINSHGTDAVGDMIEVVGDGVDGYWVTNKLGTWAAT